MRISGDAKGEMCRLMLTGVHAVLGGAALAAHLLWWADLAMREPEV